MRPLLVLGVALDEEGEALAVRGKSGWVGMAAIVLVLGEGGYKARLGALAEDLFERAKRGRNDGTTIDPLTYSTVYATLVHRQQLEMEALNE